MSETLPNKPGNFRWLWISALIILFDQIAKYYANQHLAMNEPYDLLPFFSLTLSHNRGAAFGFLNQANGWQQWLFGSLAVFISVIIIVWLLRLPRQKRLLPIALTLILGGALGNLYDRVVHGYVIDFIHLHYQQWHWPVFNIADSAICVGAFLIIFDIIRTRKEQD